MSIYSKEAVKGIKAGLPQWRTRLSAGQRLRTTRAEANLVVGLFDHAPDDLPGKQNGKGGSRNRSPRQALRKGVFRSGVLRYLDERHLPVAAEGFSTELRVLGYEKTKLARWMKILGKGKRIVRSLLRFGWFPTRPPVDPVRSFLVGRDCHRHVQIFPRPQGYRAQLWPVEYALRPTGRTSKVVDPPESPTNNERVPVNWHFHTWSCPEDQDPHYPFGANHLELGASYGLCVEVCENGDFIVSLPRRLAGRRWVFRAMYPEVGSMVLDKFLRDSGFVPHGDDRVVGWRPLYLPGDESYLDLGAGAARMEDLREGSYQLAFIG